MALLKSQSKSILINVRCTKEELKRMREKAKRYADGNISAWLRYSGVELEPRPSDLKGDKNG